MGCLVLLILLNYGHDSVSISTPESMAITVTSWNQFPVTSMDSSRPPNVVENGKVENNTSGNGKESVNISTPQSMVITVTSSNEFSFSAVDTESPNGVESVQRENITDGKLEIDTAGNGNYSANITTPQGTAMTETSWNQLPISGMELPSPPNVETEKSKNNTDGKWENDADGDKRVSVNISLPQSMEMKFSTPANVTENGKLEKKTDGNLENKTWDGLPISSFETSSPTNITEGGKVENKSDGKLENHSEAKCNIFDGKWVYKPDQNPIYEPSVCPFLSDQVSCRRNGRSDFDYDKWSWEARDCEIPRFNGTDMLERLRGKRVIVVGDSLNRNQWESLACLLYSAVPSSRAHVDVRSGVYKVFKAKDYDCTVEFYWSPFLVQLDQAREDGTRVLKLDRFPSSARKWRGADIMIFNSGHWWVHGGKSRAWDSFEYRGNLVEDMELQTALRKAMRTWAHWVDLNADPRKTKVFFRSISPEHKGKQHCFNKTQPMMDESYEVIFPKPVKQIIEKTIRRMKTPVTYLNITKLSQYRIDAHSSMFATRPFPDCSHWCLPGLPDTWNRLLYASLVLDSSSGSSHLLV